MSDELHMTKVDVAAKRQVSEHGPGASFAIDAQDWIDLRAQVTALQGEVAALSYRYRDAGREVDEELALRLAAEAEVERLKGCLDSAHAEHREATDGHAKAEAEVERLRARVSVLVEAAQAPRPKDLA